jgi:hypothetical protein
MGPSQGLSRETASWRRDGGTDDSGTLTALRYKSMRLALPETISG